MNVWQPHRANPGFRLGWIGRQPSWLLWTVGLLIGLLVVLPVALMVILLVLIGALAAILLGVMLWIVTLPLRLLARWSRPASPQPDNATVPNDGRENVRVIMRNDL